VRPGAARDLLTTTTTATPRELLVLQGGHAPEGLPPYPGEISDVATTNDLKNGITLNIDGQLWTVVDFQHVKPGKGGAFVRTRLKNVLSGKVVDRTFNAGIKVETANVDKREMQYLYREGEDFVFMDTQDYDQPRIPAATVGDAASYLLGRTVLPKFLETRLGKRMVNRKMRKWGEDFVKRHGFRAVLLGRFLVGLRGPVYLAIGAAKFSAAKFFAINAAVGAVEVSIVVGLGYYFGASKDLAHDVKWICAIVAVVLGIGLFIPIFVRRRFERRPARALAGVDDVWLSRRQLRREGGHDRPLDRPTQPRSSIA